MKSQVTLRGQPGQRDATIVRPKLNAELSPGCTSDCPWKKGQAMIELVGEPHIERRRFLKIYIVPGPSLDGASVQHLTLDYRGHERTTASPRDQFPSFVMLLSNASRNRVEDVRFLNHGVDRFGPNDLCPTSTALAMAVRDSPSDAPLGFYPAIGEMGDVSHNAVVGCVFEKTQTSQTYPVSGFHIRTVTPFVPPAGGYRREASHNTIRDSAFIGNTIWNSVEVAGGATRDTEVHNNDFSGFSLTHIDVDKGALFTRVSQNLISLAGRPNEHLTPHPQGDLCGGTVINAPELHAQSNAASPYGKAEAHRADGWAIAGSSIGGRYGSELGGAPNLGRYQLFAQCGAQCADYRLERTFSVLSGSTYVLSYWAKVDVPDQQKLSLTNVEGWEDVPITDAHWRYRSHRIKATAGTITVRFYAGTDSDHRKVMVDGLTLRRATSNLPVSAIADHGRNAGALNVGTHITNNVIVEFYNEFSRYDSGVDDAGIYLQNTRGVRVEHNDIRRINRVIDGAGININGAVHDATINDNALLLLKVGVRSNTGAQDPNSDIEIRNNLIDVVFGVGPGGAGLDLKEVLPADHGWLIHENHISTFTCEDVNNACILATGRPCYPSTGPVPCASAGISVAAKISLGSPMVVHNTLDSAALLSAPVRSFGFQLDASGGYLFGNTLRHIKCQSFYLNASTLSAPQIFGNLLFRSGGGAGCDLTFEHCLAEGPSTPSPQNNHPNFSCGAP